MPIASIMAKTLKKFPAPIVFAAEAGGDLWVIRDGIGKVPAFENRLDAAVVEGLMDGVGGDDESEALGPGIHVARPGRSAVLARADGELGFLRQL